MRRSSSSGHREQTPRAEGKARQGPRDDPTWQPEIVNRDRLLVTSTFLSSAAGILSFLLGIGTGLSEQPGAWAFFLIAAISGAAAGLCVIARDRG